MKITKRVMKGTAHGIPEAFHGNERKGRCIEIPLLSRCTQALRFFPGMMILVRAGTLLCHLLNKRGKGDHHTTGIKEKKTGQKKKRKPFFRISHALFHSIFKIQAFSPDVKERPA